MVWKKTVLFFLFFLFLPSLYAVSPTNVEVLELGDDGFVVGWSTDVPTTGQVLYGTTGRLGSATNIESSNLEHQIQISDLNPDQLYFFRVTGTDSKGVSYTSVIFLTRTTTPPMYDDLGDSSIINVKATPQDSGFDVEWNTALPLTGQIFYGTTPNLGLSTPKENAYLSYHRQRPRNLLSGTYYYRVVGEDQEGNLYESAIFSIHLGSNALQAPPLSNTVVGDSQAPRLIGLSEDIQSDHIKISWDLDEEATGQIRYGTSSNLGSVATKENNHLDFHIQRIPLSATHYQITGEDVAGNSFVSKVIEVERSPSSQFNPSLPNTDTSLPGYGSPDYYVSPDGRSSNSGLSTNSPWDLQTAMNKAKAGDTVYVRAGIYDNIRVTQNSNGQENAYISFIGTDRNWNPIDSTKTGRSFNRGDNLDETVMPLLLGRLENNIGQGWAMLINGDYVRVENFQMSRYAGGLDARGDHLIIRNIFSYYHGEFTGQPSGKKLASYRGWGIFHRGDDGLLEHLYIKDTDTQMFTLTGKNNLVRGVETYGSKHDADYSGYYFLFGSGAHNNRAEDIVVYREAGVEHLGHGVIIKTPNGEATNNIIDGFEIVNTGIELQFVGTNNNILRNGLIRTEDDKGDVAKIAVAHGANNNLVEDVEVRDSMQGIAFKDWNDGAATAAGGDLVSAGYDNIFRRITVKNTFRCIYYNTFSPNLLEDGVADGNIIEDSTFDGCERFIHVYRDNKDTIFRNNIIKNVDTFLVESGGFRLDPNTKFICNKVENSGFDESAFNTYDASDENCDVVNEAVVLEEENTAVADNTVLRVIEVSAKTLDEQSFQVEWTVSAGVTGRVEYGLTQSLGSVTPKEKNFLSFHRQQPNNLQGGRTYFYRVVGEDQAGNTYVSDMKSITLSANSASNTEIYLPTNNPPTQPVDTPPANIVDTNFLESVPQNTVGSFELTNINQLSNPANANKKAIVKRNFNLNGQTITLADNIMLSAQGGVLSNGVLSGNLRIDPAQKNKLFAFDLSLAKMYEYPFSAEWMGAKPNDVNTDQEHIYQALLRSTNVVLSPGTYLFSRGINIDTRFPTRLKGNGAVFQPTTRQPGTYLLDQLRSSDKLILEGITVDGNKLAQFGVRLASEAHLNNIEIKNIFAPSGYVGGQAFALAIDVYDQDSVIVENSRVTDVKAVGNYWLGCSNEKGGKTYPHSAIGDGDGASRAVIIYFRSGDGDVILRNNVLRRVYGDDGDIIQADAIGPWNHNSQLIIEGNDIGDASRRWVKIRTSNTIMRDNVFRDDEISWNHPEAFCPAGAVSFTTRDRSDLWNTNSIAVGNIFDGSSQYMDDFSLGNTKDLVIRENTFDDMRIVFFQNEQHVLIEDNTIRNTKILTASGSLVSDSIIRNNLVQYSVNSGRRSWIEFGFNGGGEARNILIKGNTVIENSPGAGLFRRASHVPVSNIDIIDNRLQRPGSSGAFYESTPDLDAASDVSGNVFVTGQTI